MGDKKNPFGYLIAGLLAAAAVAASVIGLSRLIPRMMAERMKKMREEGIEPPECCQGMMEECCEEPKAGKTSRKKRKK